MALLAICAASWSMPLPERVLASISFTSASPMIVVRLAVTFVKVAGALPPPVPEKVVPGAALITSPVTFSFPPPVIAPGQPSLGQGIPDPTNGAPASPVADAARRARRRP